MDNERAVELLKQVKKHLLYRINKEDEKIQALDYAIDKCKDCKICKFGSIITDGGGREHYDCDLGKKTLSPICICKHQCDHFEDKE